MLAGHTITPARFRAGPHFMTDSVDDRNATTVETIASLRNEAEKELSTAGNTDQAVEEWRVKYLGRRGALTAALRSLGTLPAADRRSVGAAANQAKAHLESLLDQRRAALAAPVSADGIDVTLPGRRPMRGRLHPSTQMNREILAAFNAMGFQTVEGPQVEWERYNFDMLNIPPDHPARDSHDTIWINSSNNRDGTLLRTHTSPMQVRVLENTKPPVRVVVPGLCYRYEATDATHEWQFHQIEGLAVDKQISFAELKGTLYEFAKRIFGSERKVRFRCDFFPFVEPGVEMAVDCFKCEGDGCRLCKQTGWIEIMGAGMVHPAVLRDAGHDPEVYRGFAFGMGPERIAMLRYGIDDIRHFFANDLRFLTQF